MAATADSLARIRMSPKQTLATRQDLLSEWAFDRNIGIDPKTVTLGSGIRAWWRCAKGHEWQTAVGNRAKKGLRCPYCSNQRVSPEKSLQATHPHLVLQWDVEKNSETPFTVSAGTGKKIWWRCNSGHGWQATVYSRAKKNTGCPYCANYFASPENCLATARPDIASEWHPEKNGSLTPNDVVAGANRKVWWKCKRGHEWLTTLNSRVSSGTGCPKCSNQSSLGELRILSELMHVFPNAQHRKKVSGMEIDIFIEELNIGIEYDGKFFHGDKETKDRQKEQRLRELGVTLIRVREPGLKKISPSDISLKSKEVSKDDVNALLGAIRQFSSTPAIDEYLTNNHFRNEHLYRAFIENFPNPLPGTSLLQTHPESANYWDYDRNHPLRPENFTKGSDFQVWWKCGVGHSTEASISGRVSDFERCPICANKFGHITPERSLQIMYPDVAKTWHPTKNGGLLPSDVSPGSSKKVWWQCEKGHEFQAAVYSRRRFKQCPRCSNFAERFPELLQFWDEARNQPLTPFLVGAQSAAVVWWKCPQGHSFKRVVNTMTRSRYVRCPECRYLSNYAPKIAAEWDYTRNDPIRPDRIFYGSTKKVWWICEAGHQYEASVSHRTQKSRSTGCPYCAGRKGVDKATVETC